MSTWRRALRYFRPDLRQVAIVVSLHLVLVGLGLAMAWPLAVMLDVVLPGNPPRTWLYQAILAPLPSSTEGRIAALALLTFALKLAQDLAGMLRTIVTNRLQHGGLMRVRSQLFRKLQRLHLGYHRSQAPGEMLYRLSQDSTGLQGVFNTAMTTAIAAATLLGMSAILGSRSLLLTALAFATLPALAVVNFRFERILRARAREAKVEDTRLLTLVQQSFSLIGLVQAFGRETDEIARFTHRSSTSAQAWVRLAESESRYWLVVGTIFGLGGAAVFGCGGYLVHRAAQSGDPAAFSAGDLLVFLAYLGLLWDPLCKLTGASTSMQTAVAGMERVFEVLDQEPAVRDADAAVELPLQPRRIELRDVAMSYPPRRSVLRGISCVVEPGQMVAFVGPSGVGKSSLLSLLPRFQDPDTGALLYDGHDARSVRVRDLRRHIALVLQEPILLPTTIAENIGYGNLAATATAIRAAGDIAGVSEFADQLPYGYDTALGDATPPLSVGQRQRIAIARAIASDAPIMVLDEPTSALDPDNERRIMQVLTRLRGQRTIVLVTHRLLSLAACDRIFVMRSGVIVEQGNFDQLLQQPGEFARLAHEQQADGEAPADAGP